MTFASSPDAYASGDPHQAARRRLVMRRGGPILGLDIGGTNLTVGVVTADGQVQAHLREASRADEGPDAMIDRIIQMGRAAIATAGLEVGDLTAVGVGCGGPLDPVRGVVLNALNNPGWIDIPVVERIEQAFRRPTYLDNDANAAALAEHRFGAGRGVRNLVYLTISTGVGAGVIVENRLVHGENGNAGELGHLVVRMNGRPCHCGSRGCVEAYCSGSSIAERAQEALVGFDGTSRMASLGHPPRAEDVLDAARAGDPLAQTIWDETMAVLGAGVVNVIHAFNPRLVLLGGGVTAAGPSLFDPLRRIVSELAIPALRDVVDIRRGELGQLSGVLGAAAVALDRLSHEAAVAVDGVAGSAPSPAPIDEREWVEHQRIVAETASQLEQVQRTATLLCEALDAGHKLVTFGNGGSAADAQHFAGELLGRFRSARRPLPAIALTTDPSTMTGIANDFGYEEVFARQVEALVEPGDVVIGLTTSGRSENVVRGLRAARARGATVVVWTGDDPGPAAAAADLVLAVPSSVTARIQEVHTLAMHVVCASVDGCVDAGSAGSRQTSGD